MTPAQIFQLAVRLLGLYFLYLAATNLLGALPGMPYEFFWRSVLGSIFFAALAWWLLGGASQLVQRAYPNEGQRPDSPRV